MNRTYSFESTIVLPRLSASDLLALVHALVTAAEAGPPPKPLTKALGRLRSRRDALEAVLVKATVPIDSPPPAQPLDRRLDALLRAQRLWLDGWAFDEPENTKRETARRLHALWYGAGAFYASSTYKVQWSEIRARLVAIDEGKLAALYEGLSGREFLEAIRRLHVAYGAVLGVTEVGSVTEDQTVTAELSALGDTVREWIGKVEATVEPDEPATRELADRILAPVTTWRSPTA